MLAELFISWRYLATRRKEKFISLISVIAILGIAIGVAALIIVIGVMTGFDRDLRDKIVGNYAHITVAGYEGIDNAEYAGLKNKIASEPHVIGVSPYAQGQILVKESGKFFAVGVKGIDPATEPQVTKVKEYLTQGSLDNLDRNSVVIGSQLAAYLGLGLGANLAATSPAGKQYNLKIAGIFNSGMYDYDMNLIFIHLACAQEILGLGTKMTAVAVKLDNIYMAGRVKEELSKSLGINYALKTWMEMNRNFFAALKLEKFTMFIILALIILVASLNIVSTLIIMVVEKTKDIGILRAIGLSGAGIGRIFTYQGLIIGGLGTFFGASLGVFLCGLLKKYQFIKLPQDIYYIDRLPVAIELWPDVALIVGSAMAITLISVIYPASRAASFKPAEALRYE